MFLEKQLFTSFTYHPPPADESSQDAVAPGPTFQISLTALLETLQIFGINDAKDRYSRDNGYGGIANSVARGGPSAAFDNRVLGMTGVCRLSYAGIGEPLCIILEEAGIVTTCELVTYEPEMQEDIPLERNALAQKVIMRADWLHDAISELSSTSPDRLTIIASPNAPYFSLSSNGPLGSANVEFSKDPQLLETFSVPARTVNTYSYRLIKAAGRAMAIASKVSIRADTHGVLSLQFMIEVEGGGVSFVDFRFMPLLAEEGDEEETEDEEIEEGSETINEEQL